MREEEKREARRGEQVEQVEQVEEEVWKIKRKLKASPGNVKKPRHSDGLTGGGHIIITGLWSRNH